MLTNKPSSIRALALRCAREANEHALGDVMTMTDIWITKAIYNAPHAPGNVCDSGWITDEDANVYAARCRRTQARHGIKDDGLPRGWQAYRLSANL